MEERIGVFVCRCGTNIAGTVDVEEVTEYASRLPGVVRSANYQFMCSVPGQELLKEEIRANGLNRVVVAACSPKMHEPTFRKACEDAGLNPYLFQMANIREQVSWVTEDNVEATLKAKALIQAAVNRVAYHEPLEAREVEVTPASLVIGGGIAGIEASLALANGGIKVYLVERSPSIGGHMAKFDKTFPTLDCSACILTPKMVQIAENGNIELMANSEVEEVSGYAGQFKVRVRKRARYVDIKKCTACGICVEKCPVKVDSEFNEGLSKRKAIYMPFPQAVPNAVVVDKENCRFIQSGKCGICKKYCPTDAINFDEQDEIVEFEVGNIIAATGFKTFDPTVACQFGFGRYDNVYTALQFERMCNVAGPTGGKILLKDGREPTSVAIAHCIGSRDVNYHEYCSRVCCMYALKFAHLLHERLPEAEIYQFYIDMRCFGKGYEDFYTRLQEEGVTFVRGKVAEVSNRAISPEERGKLIVLAEDTLSRKLLRIPVDMVILAVGLEPAEGTGDLAKTLSISQGKDGFFLEQHPKLAPVSTTTDGVFIAGACQGPKDIPDAVAQGRAAAACALSMIVAGKMTIEPYTSRIAEELCSGCKVCIGACPYQAIEFDEAKKVSHVIEAICKGCGTCAAACPAGAITANHFTTQQIMAEIAGLLSEPVAATASVSRENLLRAAAED